MGTGIFVPGTNFLADVAAENMIFHFPPELFRQGILFVFNGKVGNATFAVHNLSRENGLRGTGIDAAGAIAAIVFCWSVIFKFQGRDDHTNEIEQLRQKVKQLKLPAEALERVNKELSRLEQMPSVSAETTVTYSIRACVVFSK